MRVKLERTAFGDGFLPIPPALLDLLGWVEGDEIVIDMPGGSNDTIILYKLEKKNV